MKKKYVIAAAAVLLMSLTGCRKKPIVGPESSVSEPTASTITSEISPVESSAEHEHSWGQATVTKEATHTEEGEQTRSCLICGESKVETIPATGHSFGEWSTTKTATHTEEGEKTRTCSCGEKETQKIDKTPEHEFGAWTVTKAATCTETGTKERTCACGEKENETIAATGHDFGAWTTVAAATHTTEGYERRECKNCGQTEGQPISKTTAHEWSEWTVTKEVTCTENGSKTRSCACGEVENDVIKSTGHDFGEWTTIPSTCQVKGYEKRTCKNCGLNDTKALTEFGDHDWSEWVVDTEVTCTTDGERHRMCSTCHKIEKETLTAPGHKTYVVGQKDTHDTMCSRCGETLKSEPHDLSGDPYNVVPATCTEKGGAWYKCKVCSTEVFVSNSTAPGHNYVYSYTASGHTKTCSSCGDAIPSDHDLFGTQYCEECGWFAGTDVQIGTKFHVTSSMSVVRFTSTYAHDIALKTDDSNDFGRLKGGYTGYGALTSGQSYKTGVEAKKAVYLDVSNLVGKDVTIQYVRHSANYSGGCTICGANIATSAALREKFNFEACCNETKVYKFSNTVMTKKVALVTDLAYKRSYIDVANTELFIQEPSHPSESSTLDSTGRYFSFPSSYQNTWYLNLACDETMGGSFEAYLSPVIYDSFRNLSVSGTTVSFTATSLVNLNQSLNFGIMTADGTVKYFTITSIDNSSDPGQPVDAGGNVDVTAKLSSSGTISTSDFTNAIAFYQYK